MIELPNFSSYYELKTGFYSTLFIKTFDSNISIQIFRFEIFGSIQESIHEAEL